MKKTFLKFFLYLFAACFLLTACTSASGNSITGNSTIYIEENLLNFDPQIVSGQLDNGMSYYMGL